MSNLPSLERPTLGTRCPVCQEFQELENFCGACGWSEEGLGEATAAALRADLPDRYEDRSSFWSGLQPDRSICIHCGEYRRLDDNGFCADCEAGQPKLSALSTEELLREWAAGAGQVLALSIHDETFSLNSIYLATRRAAGWALDLCGRE